MKQSRDSERLRASSFNALDFVGAFADQILSTARGMDRGTRKAQVGKALGEMLGGFFLGAALALCREILAPADRDGVRGEDAEGTDRCERLPGVTDLLMAELGLL